MIINIRQQPKRRHLSMSFTVNLKDQISPICPCESFLKQFQLHILPTVSNDSLIFTDSRN